MSDPAPESQATELDEQPVSQDEQPVSQDPDSRRILKIHLFNCDHSLDLEVASDALLLEWEMKLSERQQYIAIEIDSRIGTGRDLHRVTNASVHVAACLRVIGKEIKRRRIIEHLKRDEARGRRRIHALVKGLSEVIAEKFGSDVKDEIFLQAKSIAKARLLAKEDVEETTEEDPVCP